MAFASEAPPWYAMALFTPPILQFAIRHPLRWPPSPTWLLRHAAVFAGVSLTVAAIYTVSFSWVRPSPGLQTFLRLYPHVVTDFLPKLVLAFMALYREAAATLAARAAAQSERQRAAMAVQLAHAQLAALESQLHPHFLFNTLDSVVALVREGNPEQASRAVVLLSEMLRSILAWRGEEAIALEQELDFIRRYVELGRLRFEDRLRVTWAIEPGLETAPILPLSLQPLVENAFRHGLEKRRQAGRLVIGARTMGDAIELFVEDDGPGPTSDASGRGIGLTSTRARLAELYGDEASLVLSPREGGGTRAVLRFPGKGAPATPTATA